jgi:hypothetical protein
MLTEPLQKDIFGFSHLTMSHLNENTSDAMTLPGAHHVTIDDDSSNISEVFTDYPPSKDNPTTSRMHTSAQARDNNNDTIEYYSCPTTPGFMPGRVFMDRDSSIEAFRHNVPHYPIRDFRTYAEAEEFTRVNIAPPPVTGGDPFYSNVMGGVPSLWPPPMQIPPYMHHMGYHMGIHPPPSMYPPFAYPMTPSPHYAPPTPIPSMPVPDTSIPVPTHIESPVALTDSPPPIHTNPTPVYVLKENTPKLEDLKHHWTTRSTLNASTQQSKHVACQLTTASSSRQRPMVLTAFNTSLFWK